MKNKIFKVLCSVMTIVLGTSILSPLIVQAEGFTGWKVDGEGNKFWYENDIKQGTEGRGKEIYDPASDAWYWLDAIDNGKMAVSKDVYQESKAGQWADNADETGKWVRYDENGHMVKGWQSTENGTYYFDLTYGTMAKGEGNINGIAYYFNEDTGVLEYSTGNVSGNANGWKVVNGIEYWYENGVRQGTEGRGKEIFDPDSNAWYWLDAVDSGKKAVSKDVYQESAAGQWADNEDGTGKWVRYDENGHMIKGWDKNKNGTYYFDPIYGTMAKGEAVIDGKAYYFDEENGICQNNVDMEETANLQWRVKEMDEYNNDGTFKSAIVYEYDAEDNLISEKFYQGNRAVKDEEGYVVHYYADFKEDMLLNKEITYQYDANGNLSKKTQKEYAIVLDTFSKFNNMYIGYISDEETYNYSNGQKQNYIHKRYDIDGNLVERLEEIYNDNGKIEKMLHYNILYYGEFNLYCTTDFEYDKNGYLVKMTEEYLNENESDSMTVYKNDAQGNVEEEILYIEGEKISTIKQTYKNGKVTSYEKIDEKRGYTTNRMEYDYNTSGQLIEERVYSCYAEEIGLQLINKTIYMYDENGNQKEYVGYSYQYDKNGKRQENQDLFAIYTYKEINGESYIESYNHYYGYSKLDKNGDMQWSQTGKGELAYNAGYEEVYNEDGSTKEYYDYTYNEQFKKVINYYTIYRLSDFEAAEKEGQIREEKVSVTYDKNDVRTSYIVNIYEAYSYED